MSSQSPISRRRMFKMSFGAFAGALVGKLFGRTPKDEPCQVTPSETAGPFYPTTDQADKDVDLTVVKGAAGRAAGDVIYVRGRVVDQDCQPVPGALVELWQANKWGRYHHEADPNPAQRDPNFQGRGETLTDADGKYGFKTIFPGAYPASAAWTRTPHLHFKVSKRGYHELTTQMYFDGQELNKTDRLIRAMAPGESERLIVELKSPLADMDPESRLCHFEIVLQKVI